MKAHVAQLSRIVLGLSAVLPALSLIAGGAASKNNAGAAAANTNALSALAPVEIPQSVFIISANPRECRNPFFPQSAPVAPLLVVRQNSTDFSSFILNGITSPPKQTAMINGSTFELGEEHEIKLPGGAKVLIKCVEIRADSAVILVGGVRRELRLRGGL